MRRKVVSVLLCTAMVASMIAGCGNKNTSDAGATGEKESTVANDQTENNEEAGNGEQVTISYACWDSNQAKLIQELANEFETDNPNIKIDIQVMAGVIIGQPLRQLEPAVRFQIHSGCILIIFIIMDPMTSC